MYNKLAYILSCTIISKYSTNKRLSFNIDVKRGEIIEIVVYLYKNKDSCCLDRSRKFWVYGTNVKNSIF